MTKKQKKPKVVYREDDGRTLYPMLDRDGRPISEGKQADAPTKKERKAMICAGYRAALPALICFLAGFTVIFAVLYLIMK